MSHVRMVQTNRFLWRIESTQGKILLEGIQCHDAFAAEKFVKNYISSFQAWSYDVVPEKKEAKREQV